ncbi:DUF2000 domain-containing protein [Nocardioides zeae]|uniref:DUF2000 domain-containing protein n=1 Tax=Nocardioides imazamoxiresistens TaxID=3231893 RepID=A0ABU3PRJ9_9ACTN|nr:DUF2000 domain-containing protein [Nocardioides zeae]MDT9591860.1 DUF2000 domain-containing protein [Nocardioides zeae]
MTTTAAVGFTDDQIDLRLPTRDVPLKWVVVVDADLPAGRAVNAAVCVATATQALVPGLRGPDAVDADGSVHPGLPWLGCSVLGAGTARLATLRARAAEDPSIVVTDMPTQAQHTRVYADYLDAVAGCRSSTLDYCAVGVVGPRAAVDRLTKGLRLLP